jgi:hypothetical protein
MAQRLALDTRPDVDDDPDTDGRAADDRGADDSARVDAVISEVRFAMEGLPAKSVMQRLSERLADEGLTIPADRLKSTARFISRGELSDEEIRAARSDAVIAYLTGSIR